MRTMETKGKVLLQKFVRSTKRLRPIHCLNPREIEEMHILAHHQHYSNCNFLMEHELYAKFIPETFVQVTYQYTKP